MITGAMGNGNQGGNGNRYGDNAKGKGGQNVQGGTSTQSLATGGIPPANVTDASTVRSVVNSYDLTGMSVTLDDGTSLYLQLGTPATTNPSGLPRRSAKA